MELGLVSGLASSGKFQIVCSVYKAMSFWSGNKNTLIQPHIHILPAYCDSLARLALANSPSLQCSSGWSQIQQGYTYCRTALGWSQIQQGSIGGNSALGLSSSEFISFSLNCRYIGGWLTDPTSIHWSLHPHLTPIPLHHPLPSLGPRPTQCGICFALTQSQDYWRLVTTPTLVELALHPHSPTSPLRQMLSPSFPLFPFLLRRAPTHTPC
jgi:hypothetical protein